MSVEKLKRIESYQKFYLQDYTFEAEIVQARQRMALEILQEHQAKVVVEISCGPELLFARALKTQTPFEQWIIVEPSEDFVNRAQNTFSSNPKLTIIKNFFEDAEGEINDACRNPIDLIICAGILNEIDNPESLLKTARTLLPSHGCLHVNVPNAYSLHRRFGKAMGLIREEKDFSERNKKLHQHQVFDMDSLKQLLKASGFAILDSGGYFLKPFSHKQMAAIQPVLTKDVLERLWMMGRNLPDWATEIYVNAKTQNG